MIDELLKILNYNFSDFEGIYFYGSRARGDYSSDSDYDIVVVFKRFVDWRLENDVLDIVCDFMVKNDILIDCKVYASNEIINPITPLRVNIKKEGIFYGI